MHLDQILLVTCMAYLHYEFGVKVALRSEVLLSEARQFVTCSAIRFDLLRLVVETANRFRTSVNLSI
jgi:hypothetical protein